MPQDDTGLTFCMWDEEYSTSDARLAIKAVSGKKSTVIKHKDAVAASVILKSFLRTYRLLDRVSVPSPDE
jgi:RNase H-fold protein (predicted Holliday junction resolvase)